MSEEKVEEAEEVAAEAPAEEVDPSGRQSDPAGEGPRAEDTGLTDAGAVLGRAVLRIARVMMRRGGRTAKRAAESGRVRLDLRQLRRDRDVMYQKLGREVRHLIEGGEISHPGLVRGVHRIEELEARIAEVEEELAARAAAGELEGDDPRDTSGEAASEEVQDEDEGAIDGGGDGDRVPGDGPSSTDPGASAG